MLNARKRAGIAALVVEIFGAVQVVVGVLVGVAMMLTVEAPCEEYRLDYSCARYAWDWETSQWQTGALLLPSALVAGSIFIMIGAYVQARVATMNTPGFH